MPGKPISLNTPKHDSLPSPAPRTAGKRRRRSQHLSQRQPTCTGRSGSWKRISLLLAILGLGLVLLSGCATDPAAMNEVFPLLPAAARNEPPPGIKPLTASTTADTGTESSGEMTASSSATKTNDPLALDAITELDSQTAADGSTGETALEATVTVRNRSVNVRNGPGLNFSVVAGAVQGTSFQVVGQTEDGGWWYICCIRGADDVAGEATQRAWISNIVVNASDDADQAPVVRPLFPDDLEATWAVNYQCDSERCEVPECTATITATVRDASDARWLEVDRTVNWDDDCGENSTWLHQIDRLTGAERYENSSGLFLFNYWAGANPGPINSLFQISADQQVKTWCSQEQTAEIEEPGGWTSVYDGRTCHDVRTGMLVSMKYVKRWLFTGTFEGEQYERAYFGDYEVYEVKLDETNAGLAVEEAANGN